MVAEYIPRDAKPARRPVLVNDRNRWQLRGRGHHEWCSLDEWKAAVREVCGWTGEPCVWD